MMDISSNMITATHKRFSNLIKNKELDFHITPFDQKIFKKQLVIKEQNCEDLSQYPDNFFDVIFGNFVIHLVENPDKMIKEVKRVLKPEGKIMFSVLADYENSSFFFVYQDLLMEFGKPQGEHRSIFHLGKQKNLETLLESKPFQIAQAKSEPNVNRLKSKKFNKIDIE